MAVVPGYKYLGPGNKINKGDPVNEVDLIAQIHDIDYTNARQDSDIRKADKEAIEKFKKADLSIGQQIGKVGLEVKYGIESFTGVLYGGGDMKRQRTLSIGNKLYSLRQKAIYKAFGNAVSRGEYHDLGSFRQSPEYRQILLDHKKGGKIYSELVQELNAAKAQENSTTDNDPSTSTRHNDPEPVPSEQPGTSTETAADSFDWDTFVGYLDSTLPDETIASTPQQQSMDISQSGTDRGPNTGSRSQTSAPQGISSSVGGANTNGWLSKSISGNSISMNFKKSRILYSYGYATKNIQPANSTEDYITTPMALIPVDFLPFYLTEAEFLSLPVGAKVDAVWCTVYPIGTRTAFDTGTTLSGSATSEYIPIGLSCIGMNTKFYGSNKLYNVDATKPMVPTNIGTIVASTMVGKYYEHVQSNAMTIPRSISEYYVHCWNRSRNPDEGKYPDYQIHNSGVVQMDQKVDQFLINSMINVPIIEYAYIPKCGEIKSNKTHYIPYARRNAELETEIYRSRSHKIQFFKNGTDTVLGAVGLGKEVTPTVLINGVQPTYMRQIENYGSFSPSSGTTGFHAQPQVHVGIQATPQLNPGNEDSNFLNSCAYWRIECGMKVSFNISSAFTKGEPISWPKEVRFVENTEHKYTDGQTLFGNTDARTGNVNSMIDTLNEYEFVENVNKKKRHQ